MSDSEPELVEGMEVEAEEPVLRVYDPIVEKRDQEAREEVLFEFFEQGEINEALDPALVPEEQRGFARGLQAERVVDVYIGTDISEHKALIKFHDWEELEWVAIEEVIQKSLQLLAQFFFEANGPEDEIPVVNDGEIEDQVVPNID